jgi:hypothetical protein
MSVPSSDRLAALAIAFALSTTSALNAASDDGVRPDAPKPVKSMLDVRIPIPHEPDASNNGCRLRVSPQERGGLQFHRIKDSMVEGGPGIDFAMLNYARKNKLLPC